MRKKLINSDTMRPHSQEEWLDLEEIARVEVTSEDPNFPIEAALAAGEGSGWRAAEKGTQIIRIVLDNPRTLRGLDSSFSRQRLSEPRSSHFDGAMRRLGRSERSFGSSGTSVRKAQPAQSKIIRSS